MPYQNRVDPFGEILAVAARGLFTGNRGVIHDPATRTLLKRRWTTKAWIICDCGYKGYRRDVMGSNVPGGGAGWTNLFFLDEVTALAAGHRPCFTCRSEAANAFSRCFAGPDAPSRTPAPEMDRRLHAERLASGGTARVLDRDEIRYLPDGVMVAAGERCFCRRGGRWLEWHFEGYQPATPPDPDAPLRMVTPPSTVAAIAAGYSPVWHPSAGARA